MWNKFCKKCLSEVSNDSKVLEKSLGWKSSLKNFSGEWCWYYCEYCQTILHLGETIGLKKMRDKKLRKLKI
jgi:wyosine [tRNA(Phe)-imidazoG37] synthetase (radical SAM superfamily)